MSNRNSLEAGLGLLSAVISLAIGSIAALGLSQIMMQMASQGRQENGTYHLTDVRALILQRLDCEATLNNKTGSACANGSGLSLVDKNGRKIFDRDQTRNVKITGVCQDGAIAVSAEWDGTGKNPLAYSDSGQKKIELFSSSRKICQDWFTRKAAEKPEFQISGYYVKNIYSCRAETDSLHPCNGAFLDSWLRKSNDSQAETLRKRVASTADNRSRSLAASGCMQRFPFIPTTQCQTCFNNGKSIPCQCTTVDGNLNNRQSCTSSQHAANYPIELEKGYQQQSQTLVQECRKKSTCCRWANPLAGSTCSCPTGAVAVISREFSNPLCSGSSPWYSDGFRLQGCGVFQYQCVVL